jgi:integrase
LKGFEDIMKVVQPIRDKEKLALIRSILRNKSGRDLFLFELGINTGLRISDLLPLKVKDVRAKIYLDLKEQKTGKARRHFINEQVREIIDKYILSMDDDHYLFPSRWTNEPIKRIQAYKILSKAAKEVGLQEIGTHTLRKTFGYWYYKQFQDVAMLQTLFNHSDPAITLQYIGISQENLDDSIRKFYI